MAVAIKSPRKAHAANTNSTDPTKKGRGRPPASGYAKEFREAIASAPDALVKAVDKIKGEIHELNDFQIEQRRKIGEKLNEIKDDTSGRYGDDPEKTLFGLMPIGRDSLRPMMKFAALYDEDDVRKLRAFKHKETEEGITWTHVSILMRAKDKATAMALAEKCVNSGMSCKDLNKAVIAVSGGRRSQGGRKNKRTVSVLETLADVTAKTTTVFNTARENWLPENGLADQYAAESVTWPLKRPPEEIVDALGATRDHLENFLAVAKALLLQVSALADQSEAARKSVRTADDTVNGEAQAA